MPIWLCVKESNFARELLSLCGELLDGFSRVPAEAQIQTWLNLCRIVIFLSIYKLKSFQ